MPEQFQLKRSSFSCDLSVSLSSLLASSSLCDVTLVCDDGHLSAHKVILAATSSFFSSVFSLNHHNHPLIYLRGIKTDQMKAILDYIYSGATQVAEEDLASFLDVAEDLKIDGLMKNKDKPSTEPKEIIKTEDSVNECQYALVDIENTDNEENEITEKNVARGMMPSDEIENEVYETYQVAEVVLSPVSFMESGPNECSNLNITKIRTTKKETEHNKPMKKKLRTTKFKPENTRITPVTTSKVSLLSQNSISPVIAANKSYPIHCPVCSTGVPNSFYLQAHMQMKSESQCKDCKLYFSSCQSIAIHKKGRCRSKLI